MPKTVLIAGATGYLGRHLVSEYMKKKCDDENNHDRVIAIVRKLEGAPAATKLVQAQVTEAESLEGIMYDNDDKADIDGNNDSNKKAVDLVISAVGITRQRDGLTYRDVDYQANMNLLKEAIRAQVPHFCYIHVLNGPCMAHLPAIQAKQDFVNALEKAVKDGKIAKATIICPSGFFSDMNDFFEMAKGGRAYLFGDGSHEINPIHGEDLAAATAHAIDQTHRPDFLSVDIGGPDVFTHAELCQLAFDVVSSSSSPSSKNSSTSRPSYKITYIWDSIRTSLIRILPWITPLTIWGPAQFLLTAMGMDMVGNSCCDIIDHDEQRQQSRRQGAGGNSDDDLPTDNTNSSSSAGAARHQYHHLKNHFEQVMLDQAAAKNASKN